MARTGVMLDVSGRLKSVQVLGGAGPAAGGDASSPVGRTAEQADMQLQAALQAERDRLGLAQAALEEGAAKLAELRGKVLREAEEQLLELAIDIAGKVLMQEIKAGRHEIEPIVKEALSHVAGRQDVAVYLNPDDLAQCELARQADDAGQGGHVRFLADPSMRRGQCLVKTADGVVESSPEAHLEDIAEVLKAPE